MKYAIVIPDGSADDPQEALGGRTPLEAADLSAMDRVARDGVLGRSNNVPESLDPGSDVANLSLLGYDPMTHFTGRAPLEAAAQGIELGPEDWAVRCNLVTVLDQVMRDFTAGHISTPEATALLESAQAELGSENIRFHPGVGYRNLLVWRNRGSAIPFSPETRTTPPHDLTDKSVADGYPRGPGSDLLTNMMGQSLAVFEEHPVNVARRAAGKSAATNIWLWGLGRMPRLAPFAELHGVSGAMLTAVDLLRGLAKLIGWRRIDVPGATGYTDTDYAAKGRYAIDALDKVDLVCVHVEAPDEASHEGDLEAKVKALEEIDRHIVGPVHEALKRHGEYRILVSPDHPTPLATKTHSHGCVPWAIAGSGVTADKANSYDDPTAMKSDLVFEEGWKLMEYFLKSE
jgi:2,3-bisphosphoglycerate-independent phosphoglycerate mutase